MIAHISLSHLTDPAVLLTGTGLLVLYALWRTVLRPRLQNDEGTRASAPTPGTASPPHSP